MTDKLLHLNVSLEGGKIVIVTPQAEVIRLDPAVALDLARSIEQLANRYAIEVEKKIRGSANKG